MFLNGFSVRIVGGPERSHGYVALRHGQTYKLALANKNQVRCDARVTIDGKEVGTWRLSPGETATLERPSEEPKFFTFYKADSDAGRKVGSASVHAEMQGLLEVLFTPEDTTVVPPTVLRSAPPALGGSVLRGMSFGAPTRGVSGQNIAAGTTGLTGSSSQRFNQAAHMPLDHGAGQTIMLRLVCDDTPALSDPQPLRPQGQQATPVPPPV